MTPVDHADLRRDGRGRCSATTGYHGRSSRPTSTSPTATGTTGCTARCTVTRSRSSSAATASTPGRRSSRSSKSQEPALSSLFVATDGGLPAADRALRPMRRPPRVQPRPITPRSIDRMPLNLSLTAGSRGRPFACMLWAMRPIEGSSERVAARRSRAWRGGGGGRGLERPAWVGGACADRSGRGAEPGSTDLPGPPVGTRTEAQAVTLTNTGDHPSRSRPFA